MQFITTDQRIAVEAFTVGKIYQVNFTDSNYFIGACIGTGDNFVMFQRTAPDSLFSLTMESAASVSSIDEAGGGSGTTDYNDLSNKPQINSVELQGNKTLAELGIQPELTQQQQAAIDLITSGGGAVKPYATIGRLGYAIKVVTLQDLTFSKTSAGLFYSSAVNISSEFDLVLAATLRNFGNLQSNIAIMVSIHPTNCTFSFWIQDSTNPQTLPLTAQTQLQVVILGIVKESS